MRNKSWRRKRPLLIFTFLCALPLCVFAYCISSAEETGKETVPAEAVPPAQEPQVSAPAEKAAGTVPAEAAPTAETAAAPDAGPARPEEPAEVVMPGNVTVNFKGADIRTVLAYISEVSGVDIVPAPDVKGPVDLKLNNKPWKVALDIIVRNYGFAYEREGDIIRVITVDKLKQEELVTQAFSLNYGKAKDIVTSVKDIVSDRGKVMYDDRTNIVLVTDIPTNIYKIGEVISKLDRKTDQVLIEARVIETVLTDEEKLGIDWNIKFTASGAKRPITAPFDYYDVDNKLLSKFTPLVQTEGVESNFSPDGSGSSTTTTPGKYPAGADGAGSRSMGFPYIDYSQEIFQDTFKFGTLDFSEFKMVLELIKSRANTEVVSNPRIATLNNVEALINVGQTLNLPKYERNSTTGKMEITGYESKDLGIILKVTPHINEKGEIVVDLAPQISDLLRYDTLDASSGVVAPVFSSRQAKTQIMIKDGETIFIGGLIKENNVDVKKKVPFIGDLLGDVPYLGLLFTKKETTKQKTELIFFITVNLVVSGKEIKNIPSVSKAYVPMYDVSQEDAERKADKKKMKRKKL
ncbi:MAG: secretin N-terminal domain-containing protein [Candidatus Omnitrophota bacterium]